MRTKSVKGPSNGQPMESLTHGGPLRGLFYALVFLLPVNGPTNSLRLIWSDYRRAAGLPGTGRGYPPKARSGAMPDRCKDGMGHRLFPRHAAIRWYSAEKLESFIFLAALAHRTSMDLRDLRVLEYVSNHMLIHSPTVHPSAQIRSSVCAAKIAVWSFSFTSSCVLFCPRHS